MNFLIDLGILVIAFGSYLIYLGNKKDNDKSQKILIDQINSFKQELNNARNDESNVLDKTTIIEDISNEFDSWAKHLIDNYSELELSHEKLILNESEEKLTRNKKWGPIFSKIFNNLIQMVESINKTATNKIKIHSSNSAFPKNIFTDKGDLFFQILEFNQEDFLKVKISYLHYSKTYKQLIQFTHYKNLEEAKMDFLSIDKLSIFFNENDTFHISTDGSFNSFEYKTSENKYDEYSISETTDLLKKIVQYQFITSNKKTFIK